MRCLFVLFLIACQPVEMQFTGPTMGTHYSVKTVATKHKKKAIEQAIATSLQRIDALMSTYRDDSELMRFNRATKSLMLSPENTEVIQAALTLSAWSQGAFDITVFPAIKLWGFGPHGKKGVIPTQNQLNALRVGFEHLNLEKNILYKDHPDIECDLSAIAPGYAADLIARKFQQLGLSQFLIDVGGEIVAQGKPWKVAVEIGERDILQLDHQAVATSGDYRNFFMHAGKRYSHTLDPRTLKPVDHDLAAVTVVHQNSAMLADGFATAMMVLGSKEALQLANQHDLGVLLLVRDPHGTFKRISNENYAKLKI